LGGRYLTGCDSFALHSGRQKRSRGIRPPEKLAGFSRQALDNIVDSPKTRLRQQLFLVGDPFAAMSKDCVRRTARCFAE
jgi:hypothetical protein